MKEIFFERKTIEQVEEGSELAPKFNSEGLIPAITTDYSSGEVLILGYMNKEALEQTILTGEAHYYSRSREKIWRKGATSGLIQKIKQLLVDDDQDSIWLRVEVLGNGASCHVGYRSCFYRSVPFGRDLKEEVLKKEDLKLEFTEKEKVFDPEVMYPGVANPTKL